MTTTENELVPAPATRAPEVAVPEAAVVAEAANGDGSAVPAGEVGPKIPAEAVIGTEPAAETPDSMDDDAVESIESTESVVEIVVDDVVVDEVVVGGSIVVDEPDEPAEVDTVERAEKSPDEPQPHRELGLQDDEYEKIRSILGRRPTRSELGMYSIMWSEHCSYKSSKVHLRQFAEKAPQSDRMLAGIGENAGVVKVSDHLAVTFKVESHNHPSFVEPYQGAATGVGGIVRDILAMGARPIAVMDPLRFGDPEHPDTARVLTGIVAGVGGYGNCLGLPNIGGELSFDP